MEKNLFRNKKIRALYSEKTEKWYFCAVDICAALTGKDTAEARKYWNSLRYNLKNTCNQLVANCEQLKMKSRDGRLRFTEVLDITQILYLIQIIPAKEAEPFKIWLAKTAAAGEAAAALIEAGKDSFQSTLDEVRRDKNAPVQLKSVEVREIPLE